MDTAKETMRRILTHVAEHGELPELNEGDDTEALAQCVSKKYLAGVYPRRMASGIMTVEISSRPGEPAVTERGRDFLANSTD